MTEIVMYMRPTCPFCQRATALLQSKGMAIEFIDLNENPALKEEMIQKTGRNTVPQIYINNQHVGGCDDLEALEASGKLDEMLK